MSIAIVKDDFSEKHSGSWSAEWLAACEEYGIAYELVDWRAPDALARLLRHGQVLWHFSNYSASEMAFARNILNALEHTGCRVFPGFVDSWHFDDKVAQAFLLEAIGAPTPENYVFFSMGDVEAWIAKSPTFPVVAKLRTGSGSSNVQLIEKRETLRRYAARMFGKGLSARPKAIFKVSSNIRSSKSFSDVVRRAKRAPEFLFSLAQARALPRERGYVYLQEFIAGASYDIKVVVIGDKLSFIGRHIRKHDFRASGGGDLFYDKKIITDEIIDTAFRVADSMKSVCLGMDFVIDPVTSKRYIVEISYGFSHTALLMAGGYYDRSGTWHATPLNAPREVLGRITES